MALGSLVLYASYAILAAGVIYGIYMMTKGQGAPDDMRPNSLDDFNITTADEGTFVPLVYGTKKITGNIIWYGNLYTSPIEEEIGSGSSSQNVVVGHRYYIDVWMTLAHGPISIKQTYLKEELLINGENDLDYQARYFSDGTPGNGVTAPSVVLGDSYPYISPLPGVAWVCYKRLYIGDNTNTIPTLHYVVERDLTGVHPIDNPTITYTSQYYDTEQETLVNMSCISCNPGTAIYDVLLKSGGDFGDINLASFNAASEYWYDKDYGINVVFKVAPKARDAIRKILSSVGGSFTRDDDGLFYLIAFDEDDTADTTLDFDDGDIRNFRFTRPMWDELSTDFIGNYIDETQGYSKRTVRAYNPALYRILGRAVPATIDLTNFNNVNHASKRIWEIMKESTYPAAEIVCELPIKHSSLLVGEKVKVTNSRFSISEEEYRIMSKDVRNFEDNYFTVELRQVLETIYADDWIPGGDPDWVPPDFGPDPLYKYEYYQIPPNHLLDIPYNSSYGYYVILVVRANTHETGYQMEEEFNGTVMRTELLNAFSQYGQLNLDYGLTNEIDETEGLTYTPYREEPEFDSINIESAMQMQRVALVNDELIGFATVTTNANGSITLTDCIRGMLGTTMAEHTAGDDIWLFNPRTSGLIWYNQYPSFQLNFRPYTGSDMLDDSLKTTINVSRDNTILTNPDPVLKIEKTGADEYKVNVYPSGSHYTGCGAGYQGEENVDPTTHSWAADVSFDWKHTSGGSLTNTTNREFTITQASLDLYVRYVFAAGNSGFTRIAPGSLPANVGDIVWSSNADIPDSNSGLVKLTYGMESFWEVMDYDFGLIEDMLNVSDLLDTNITSIADEDYLMYDYASGKFVNVDWATFNVNVTTTTSTTSTTSTTTSTVTVTTTTLTTTGTTVSTSTVSTTTVTVDEEAYSTGHLKIGDTPPNTSGTMPYKAAVTDGLYANNVFDDPAYIYSDTAITPPTDLLEEEYQAYDTWNYRRSLGINLESSTTVKGLKIKWKIRKILEITGNDRLVAPRRTYNKLGADPAGIDYVHGMFSLWSSTDGGATTWQTIEDYLTATDYYAEAYDANAIGYNPAWEWVKNDGGAFQPYNYLYQGDQWYYTIFWFDSPVTSQYFKVVCETYMAHYYKNYPVELEVITSDAETRPTVGWMGWAPSWYGASPPNNVPEKTVSHARWLNKDGPTSWFQYGSGSWLTESSGNGYRDLVYPRPVDKAHCIVDGEKTTGKWYVEFEFDSLMYDETGDDSTIVVSFGVAQEHYWYSGYYETDDVLSSSDYALTPFAVAYRNDGKLVDYDGETTFAAGTFNRGDIIGVAIDVDNQKVWFSKNGVWQGAPASGTGAAFETWVTSGSYTYWSQSYDYLDESFAPFMAYDAPNTAANNERFKVITHEDHQTYSPPSGFTSWGD